LLECYFAKKFLSAVLRLRPSGRIISEVCEEVAMALPIYADDDGAGSAPAILPPPGMTAAAWVALPARHFQETRTARPA
jgi:hypothetical protein